MTDPIHPRPHPRLPIVFSGVIFLLFLAPSLTAAQEVRRAFDPEGELETIDRELEEKLGLFSEYQGFREARLYQQADSSYVLEIVYRPDGETLRERHPLSRSEVEDLRYRVMERLQGARSPPALNQQGRTELLVNSTLLALGFYGYAVPVSLRIEDGTGIAALYVLTSGAGFFGPYVLTRDRSVTEGQAKLVQYGGTRGIDRLADTPSALRPRGRFPPPPTATWSAEPLLPSAILAPDGEQVVLTRIDHDSRRARSRSSSTAR